MPRRMDAEEEFTHLVVTNFVENSSFLDFIATFEKSDDLNIQRKLLIYLENTNPFQTLILRYMSNEALRPLVYKTIKIVKYVKQMV